MQPDELLVAVELTLVVDEVVPPALLVLGPMEVEALASPPAPVLP
jgi:hypothetical protein